MIPEFIGRVPLVATLDDLDESALINILTQTKNAIVKQYQALFDMDGVKLKVEEDALKGIAKQAIEHKTGARGLRSIMENILLNPMFDIPGDDTAKELVITADVVSKKAEPVVVHGPADAEGDDESKDKKKPVLKAAKDTKEKESA